MPAAARVGASVIGGTLMVAGGQMIQRHGAAAPAAAPVPVGQVAPPIPTGTAGVIVAITGLVMASVPVLDRLVEVKRLRKALERAHVKMESQASRIDELEQVARGNKGLIAGTDAKADEAIRALVASGDIEPARPGAARPSPTLLIVEDDPSTVGAYTQIFTRAGWAVHSATTIGDALIEVEKGHHYVLLDLKLAAPGDGLIVLRHIYEMRVACHVVVVSGAPDSGAIMAECRRLRPDAVLRKPFRFADLLEAVKADVSRPDAVELDRRAGLVAGSGEMVIPMAEGPK